MRQNSLLTTFYVVRHGVTAWNKKWRVQGQSDIPLDQEGEKQAMEALRRFFKGIKFDLVFSSDLLRFKRTAEIIATEKKMAVLASKLLRERNFGPWEGKSRRELEKELKMSIFDFRVLTDIQLAKLGIETDTDLASRFITFIREVSLAYPGKKVLVVTHGSLMRVFLIKIGYLTREQSKTFVFKNLGFFIFESDGVEFKLLGIEGYEYLDEKLGIK